MDIKPEYILINGVVYKHVRTSTRQGIDEYYLRVSVPARAVQVGPKYPVDRLPAHEVITAEQAKQIRFEALAAIAASSEAAR